MSNFQKVIKYIAIAFAVLIIFNIISGIIAGIGAVSNIFSEDVNSNLNEVKIDGNYSVLDIELDSINILIKEGEKFKIKTNSDNISFKEVGDKLLITEKKSSWLPKKADTDIVIYVSNDYTFEEVLIENGAGRVDVDYIKTNNLELDLGAGQVNLNRLDVYKEASIDGGVGEVVVKSGTVNNLDLDMGVGKVELNLEIIGNSEIDSGIGEVKLVLLGNSSNYSINIDKGVGNIEIDGVDVGSSTSYGDGSNIINVDGGIGNISIDFEK